MTEYIAFLRGINVGGKRSIKMSDLSRIFVSSGFADVNTYIQSGNISFSSESSDTDYLKEVIESDIQKQLGHHVRVMIRTPAFIRNIIKNNPFQDRGIHKESKLYICFLEKTPVIQPHLPLINQKEGLELIHLDNKEAYIISKKVNGRFGFPNNFIEKELEVISTTRNWSTINKLIIEHTVKNKPGNRKQGH